MATTPTIDSALASFDRHRDQFLATVGDIPGSALGYLRTGDEYTLGGLIHHVNHVLEHYTNVVAAMVAADFGECRPRDPEGLEATAHQRASEIPTRGEMEAARARLEELHAGVRARLASLGDDWTRKARVFYGDATEAFPTSGEDVLGWLDGHYLEHVPQITTLIAEWAGTNAGSEVQVGEELSPGER